MSKTTMSQREGLIPISKMRLRISSIQNNRSTLSSHVKSSIEIQRHSDFFYSQNQQEKYTKEPAFKCIAAILSVYQFSSGKNFFCSNKYLG